MLERVTARVLLLDPQGRILLMKGRLPGDSDGPGAWFTIGGGVEPGESVAEAAAREVVEETGFKDAEIGEVAWRSEQIINFRNGAPVLFKESYLIAHCAGDEPSRAGWQAHEHELIDDIRWWAIEDLAACAEPVFPLGLALRLARLAAGEPQIVEDDRAVT